MKRRSQSLRARRREQSRISASQGLGVTGIQANQHIRPRSPKTPISSSPSTFLLAVLPPIHLKRLRTPLSLRPRAKRARRWEEKGDFARTDVERSVPHIQPTPARGAAFADRRKRRSGPTTMSRPVSPARLQLPPPPPSPLPSTSSPLHSQSSVLERPPPDLRYYRPAYSQHGLPARPQSALLRAGPVQHLHDHHSYSLAPNSNPSSRRTSNAHSLPVASSSLKPLHNHHSLDEKTFSSAPNFHSHDLGVEEAGERPLSRPSTQAPSTHHVISNYASSDDGLDDIEDDGPTVRQTVKSMVSRAVTRIYIILWTPC